MYSCQHQSLCAKKATEKENVETLKEVVVTATKFNLKKKIQEK